MQQNNLSIQSSFYCSTLNLACSSRTVKDGEALKSWVNGPVQEVLPHHAAIFGQFVSHSGGYASLQRWSTGLPPCYLASVTRPGQNMRSPVFERLLKSQGKPYFFDVERDGEGVNREWLAQFKQAGWRNLLGMVYQEGEGDEAVMTAIGLYNVAPETESQMQYSQTLVMPHLHKALSQTYAATQAELQRETEAHRTTDMVASVLPKLTPSEEALLPLLADGKTTKEIAKILNKSDHTVKHQLAALMHKCQAKTRTELVIRLKPPPLGANAESLTQPYLACL